MKANAGFSLEHSLKDAGRVAIEGSTNEIVVVAEGCRSLAIASIGALTLSNGAT